MQVLTNVFLKAILTKLNEKARHALANAQRDPSPVMPGDGGLLWNIKKEDTDDELSILAGHTRLVSTQRGSRNPSPSRQYNPSPSLFPAAGQLSQHKSHEALDHLSQSHLSLNVPSAYLQPTPPRLSNGSSNITDAWTSSISSEPRTQQYQSALGVDERLPSHYPYITSTAHQQQSENSTGINTYGWSNDPRLHHSQSQRCLSSASSASSLSSATNAHQLPSSQSMHSHQSPTNQSQHQLQHHNDHQSQYHAHNGTHVGNGGGSPLDVPSSTHHSNVYPSHDHQQHLLQDLSPPPSAVRPHEHPDVYSMYGSSNSNSRSSVYHGLQSQTQTSGAPPNMDLAHLGLASRDSRLDERWGPFMADSGLLEGSR